MLTNWRLYRRQLGFPRSRKPPSQRRVAVTRGGVGRRPLVGITQGKGPAGGLLESGPGKRMRRQHVQAYREKTVKAV